MYEYITLSCNGTDVNTLFVRHVAQIGEYYKSREKTCETVYDCCYDTVPIKYW